MTMSLEQQKTELEGQGFKIVEESPETLVAVRQRWHWDCVFSKLTAVVFVRRVGTLTTTQLETDRAELEARAKNLDPSILPRGFQKGTAVLTAYIADQIEEGARALCEQKPRVRFAWFYLPGVLNLATGQAHFLRTTPLWGAIFFGKFRYILGRLLEPKSVIGREPLSVFGTILTVLIVVMLVASLALLLRRR
jgi:hypothetical protein